MQNFWQTLNLFFHTDAGTVVIALLILILGSFLARLLSRAFPKLLERVTIDDRLSAWLKWEKERFNRLTVHIVFWPLEVLSIWLALWVAFSTPTLRDFLKAVQNFIAYLAQIPAMVFAYDVFLAVLATWALNLLLRWLGRGFAYLENWLQGKRNKFRPLKIQRLVLLTSGRILALLVLFFRYLRIGISAILLLAYASLVFSIFPQTRGYVSALLATLGLVLLHAWSNFTAYLPNLLQLVLIIIATHYALKLVHYFFNAIGKGNITIGGFYTEWSEPTYQLVRILIVVLALVVAFPFIPGSSSPAFQGVSIFIGFLFSLGSSSVVANIVAGVVLTYTRAFKVGDRVQIADTVGDVIERTLLVTHIRTIKNVDVTIPNSLVLGSHIINYSASAGDRGLILNTTVTIGYDAPWPEVHKALIAAALATEGVLPEPKPFVLQTALDDFYVSYEINAYTNQPNRMAVIYSNLHQNIQDTFNAAGIEITSPHYAALRDGNETTIPANVRPKEYKAPGFRLEK